MEVKSGYKQTEVGVIPEDWRAEYLDRCVRSDAPICYGILMPGEHCNHGVPVVKVRDILGGRIDRSNLLLTHPSIDEAYKRSRLRFGDVLITIRGTTGRVAVVTKELHGANITQDTARVRINPNESNEFVYYALQSQPVQHQVALHTIGQAVKGINIRDVRRLVIPLPGTLLEQRAIAEALSEMDGLLDGLDRLIAKKHDIKQAAMQQLLTGKHRLPGFQGEWEAVSLGELFSFKNGLNKGKEYFGIGTPIVNYMDVYQHCGLSSKNLQGRVMVNKQELKAFDVKKGDVFFTRTSETVEEIGIAAIMLDDCSDTVFSGFLLRARPKDESLCNNFKKYMFSSQAVRRQIVTRSSYTTRALTNGRLLSAVILQRPPKEEQSAIAAVLSDMDSEIAALEERRDKTRAIKQGMMQELLTGKTRLIEASQASYVPA
jgi:type I restriction enzyme S subunit